MNTIVLPTEELPLSDDASRRRPHLDDDGLVRAAVAGDANAFAALLQRHDDKMRGVVWRVVGSSSAMDDVLQEAYLKAWRGIGGYARNAAFSTWLYTIVHRSAIDWVRAQRRQPPGHLRIATDTDFPAATIRDHASGVTDSLALQHALTELPEDQLAVVTLIDGEGYSYDDVATLLDISPGTVASRLHRARAALRERLESPDLSPGEGTR